MSYEITIRRSFTPEAMKNVKERSELWFQTYHDFSGYPVEDLKKMMKVVENENELIVTGDVSEVDVFEAEVFDGRNDLEEGVLSNLDE